MSKKIPDAVSRRLPRYYRELKELENSGEERISSLSLSKRLGFTASQIRQDLNHFGGFGQQGYGYHVSELRDKVASIMGIDKVTNIVIIGAGNIGRALARHKGFAEENFKVKAMFDKNEDLVGTLTDNIPIMHIDNLQSYIDTNHVDIAVLAVPSSFATKVAMQLKKSGIKAMWNFAPININLEGVVVENIHLTDSLMVLAFNNNRIDE